MLAQEARRARSANSLTNQKKKLMSVNNIKVGLREIEWDGMDRIDLAQEKQTWRDLVNMVMNFHFP
jgi:hypothetical protein